MRTEREWPVLVFAGLVCILLVLAAFATDRTGYVDELGLYNPSYMLAQYGNLTYPVNGSFDQTIVIHPPVHAGVIGLFSRLGFTWYYAEAMPTFLWFLLGIVAIVRARFPAIMKLGLLFSIAFLLHGSGPGGGFEFSVFGMRPEGHVVAAWLTGLILLESGRLENWRKSRLLAGAFALAWAAGVHYYAVGAGLGVIVYMAVGAWQLGWRKAMPAVVAMAAGACLFGIPYILFFLWPHHHTVLEVLRSSQGSGGISQALGLQWSIYRKWAIIAKPLVKLAVSTGVPLLVFSTAILAAIRCTRVLALAALPIQAFIFFFASHKQDSYLIHEAVIFGLAVSMGALALAGKLVSRIPNAGVKTAFLPVSAAFLCLYLAIGNETLRAARISVKPHLQEADVARAAARKLLDPNAVVASNIALWYGSGGTYWYGIPRIWPIRRQEDSAHFFECFDASAMGEFDSAVTGGTPGESISAMYADGSLKLRGFYFGHSDPELQFVLLHPHAAAPLAGYAAQGERLFRFDERPGGDRELISAVCPELPETGRGYWRYRWPATPSAVLYLPQPRADGAIGVVTALTARNEPEPAGEIAHSCRVFSRIPGALHEVDKYALVEELRHTDVPIQFFENPTDIPGFLGCFHSGSH